MATLGSTSSIQTGQDALGAAPRLRAGDVDVLEQLVRGPQLQRDLRHDAQLF